MVEQVISFETAVLAKEKGFKESTSTAFLIKDDEVFESEWDGFGGWYSDKIKNHIVFYDKKICRPTQALLQKWLREVHCLDVSMSSCKSKDDLVMWSVMIYNLKRYDTGYNSFHYIEVRAYKDEYEAALEIGLLNALKYIK